MVRRKTGFSARALKTARERSGLTQVEIAARLSIHQNQYSRYEVGKAEPSGYLIKRMAGILNVSADYLLGLPPALTLNDLTEEETRLILAMRAKRGPGGRIVDYAIKPAK